MDIWLPVLASNATQAGNHAGGGGFVGWVLVFGSICFMNTWLMVYSIHLSGQRAQGVYFWMVLTLLFGPFAILALLRQPIIASCGVCGADWPLSETSCPTCGAAMETAWREEPIPRFPDTLDDEHLTS